MTNAHKKQTNKSASLSSTISSLPSPPSPVLSASSPPSTLSSSALSSSALSSFALSSSSSLSSSPYFPFSLLSPSKIERKREKLDVFLQFIRVRFAGF